MKAKSYIAHMVSALMGLTLPSHPALPSLTGRNPRMVRKGTAKKKTRADFERLAAAQAKRERKAAKRVIE